MRGTHQSQYTLYIRRGDHAMHLVEQRTGITVAIEKVLVPSKGVDGIFIRLQEAERVGVYLMEDEIRVVDSLPECKSKSEVKS
jgi:hypothetical protein